MAHLSDKVYQVSNAGLTNLERNVCNGADIEPILASVQQYIIPCASYPQFGDKDRNFVMDLFKEFEQEVSSFLFTFNLFYCFAICTGCSESHCRDVALSVQGQYYALGIRGMIGQSIC